MTTRARGILGVALAALLATGGWLGCDNDPDPGDGDADADADADSGGDADGGGEPIPCTFNRDCTADRRCECEEETGCFCLPGVRGTGQSGVDPCTDGNDCESALCIEGIDQFYCSDECEDEDGCEANLPVCLGIAFLGRVCVRVPPDSGN